MENIVIKGNINVMMSTNKAMMSSQITIDNILKLYKIDSEVNRDLSYNRIPNLIKYIKNKDSKIGIYFPAFVFSFRENPLDYYDKENCQLVINKNSKLIVIDGQHRIKSIEKYINTIKDEHEKEKLLNNTITCQIYFGLKKEDERKLFSDINSNSKKVSLSLATKYDSRDIINILVQEVYRSSNELQVAGIELDKSKIYRPKNKKFCTGKRLSEFILYLVCGKCFINHNEELLIKKNYEEIICFLDRFFSILFSNLPDSPGDVEKYVLGHKSFQDAIALYCNKMIFNHYNSNNFFDLINEWEEYVQQLKYIDWSINNPIWSKWLIKANTRSSFMTFIDKSENEIMEAIQQEIF